MVIRNRKEIFIHVKKKKIKLQRFTLALASNLTVATKKNCCQYEIDKIVSYPANVLWWLS